MGWLILEIHHTFKLSLSWWPCWNLHLLGQSVIWTVSKASISFKKVHPCMWIGDHNGYTVSFFIFISYLSIKYT